MKRTAYTYFTNNTNLLFEVANECFEQAWATVFVDGRDRGNLTSDRTSLTCA